MSSVLTDVQAPVIEVRVAPSGAWIIRDTENRLGGRFRTEAAARRFIVREIGKASVLLFRPWPKLGG
jgi:hypothetical protein